MSPLANWWLVEVVFVEVVAEGVFLRKMKKLVAVAVVVEVLPGMMRKVVAVVEGVVVVVVQTLATIKAFLHRIKTTKLE